VERDGEHQLANRASRRRILQPDHPGRPHLSHLLQRLQHARRGQRQPGRIAAAFGLADARGEIRWTKEIEPKLPEQDRIREEHGYATSTPAADEERVIAFFGKSGVIAFDHSGKQLWQTSVGEELSGWGSAASPVLYNGLVIINASVESESLIALDAKTGREVWRARDIKDSWNTPILVQTPEGRTELVVAMFQKILGFDPAKGTRLWSCDTDIPWYMAPSLVADRGIVYSVGGRPGGGLAVRTGGRGDVTGTHRLWTIGKGSNVTSPIIHDGRLYWMHDNLGIAFCADAASGEILYEERIPRGNQVYASPVLADDKIYYLARDGKTYVVPAAPEFEILAVNTFGERGAFNASPAVAGGRIYIRSNRYLYCIGAK
jgi:outer membrane protein assembly factor BamB